MGLFAIPHSAESHACKIVQCAGKFICVYDVNHFLCREYGKHKKSTFTVEMGVDEISSLSCTLADIGEGRKDHKLAMKHLNTLLINNLERRKQASLKPFDLSAFLGHRIFL